MRVMDVGMVIRSGREVGDEPSLTTSYVKKRTNVWLKMLAIVQINEYNIRCR